jgi:hypothetical protein
MPPEIIQQNRRNSQQKNKQAQTYYRFLNRVISQVNIPIAKIIGNTLIVIRNQQTIRRGSRANSDSTILRERRILPRGNKTGIRKNNADK